MALSWQKLRVICLRVTAEASNTKRTHDVFVCVLVREHRSLKPLFCLKLAPLCRARQFERFRGKPSGLLAAILWPVTTSHPVVCHQTPLAGF